MKVINQIKHERLIKQLAGLKRDKNYYEYIKNDKKINSILNKILKVNNKIDNLQTKITEDENSKLTEYQNILKNENVKDTHEMNLAININNDFKRFNEKDDIQLMITNLTMQFGGLRAVDNLSIEVKKGEIYGLIGPNGAGKTTVFNCITQFYKPKEGSIFFKDQENVSHILNNFKTHDVIPLGLSRTFQNVELIWELNVLDNLLVGGHSLYSSGFFTQLFHLPKLRIEEKMFKEKALKILDMLGISDYKFQMPFGLPYGILKKIELARTLMTDPKLIILDEPAAGLNDSETVELAKTIKKIRDDFNVTIFLVEHDMGLVMDICDRICAISFGKKIAVGTPREIQNNEFVQEAYLGGK